MKITLEYYIRFYGQKKEAIILAPKIYILSKNISPKANVLMAVKKN